MAHIEHRCPLGHVVFNNYKDNPTNCPECGRQMRHFSDEAQYDDIPRDYRDEYEFLGGEG